MKTKTLEDNWMDFLKYLANRNEGKQYNREATEVNFWSWYISYRLDRA